MRIRSAFFVIIALLAGVVMGALLTWSIGLGDGARIQVVEGQAWVNEEGTAGGGRKGRTAG